MKKSLKFFVISGDHTREGVLRPIRTTRSYSPSVVHESCAEVSCSKIKTGDPEIEARDVITLRNNKGFAHHTSVI